MPWNAKLDAGRLALGIPPSNFWALGSRTASTRSAASTPPRASSSTTSASSGAATCAGIPPPTTGSATRATPTTPIVKRSGDRFTDLVKRTYRVLLTRGLKGCTLKMKYPKDKALEIQHESFTLF